jgi:hypothetical protein
MGKVKTKYISDVFILERARPRANILSLVLPYWDVNSPKPILHVWCLDAGMGKAQN